MKRLICFLLGHQKPCPVYRAEPTSWPPGALIGNICLFCGHKDRAIAEQ